MRRHARARNLGPVNSLRGRREMEPKAPLSVADESVPETAGASLVAQSRSGAVTQQKVGALVDFVYSNPRPPEKY